MRTTTACILLCSLGTLPTADAESADSRFYGGVSIGNSSVDGRASAPATIRFSPQLPSSLSINALPFDDDDTTWSVFMGYNATQYVGLELGYSDHGTFRNELTGPDPASLSIEEFHFGAMLRYPLTDRLSLTGGAGVSRARFDVDGSVGVLVVNAPPFPSLPFPVLPPIVGLFPISGVIQYRALDTPDDETGGYWKVGVNWRFTDSLEAGFNYGQRDLQVQEVETLTLSLQYAF